MIDTALDRARRELVDKLREWWSFNAAQQHTHSWHEREDFIDKHLPDSLAHLEAAAREEGRCHHGWRGGPPENGERIVTPCPACGLQSLFIGTNGHLTCASVPKDRFDGCPDPSVEQAIEHKIAAARLAGRLEQAERTCEELGITEDDKMAVHVRLRLERDRLRREAGK